MNKKGVKILAISMALAVISGSIAVGIGKSNANNAGTDITVENGNSELDSVEVNNACNSHVDGEEMSVDEMKNHLMEHGYKEEDMALIYVCTQVEELQEYNVQEENAQDINIEDISDNTDNVENTEIENEDKENNTDNETTDEQVDSKTQEIIDKIDEQLEMILEEDNDGSTGSIQKYTTAAFDIWNALKPSEKVLVVKHPAKALAVNATSCRATELAIMNFGVNGLGDKSDAFRHAMWNCLMTREIGKKYAEKFATAHEGNKTEEELQVIANDGFPEYMHMEMDMHNNEVGRNIIGETEDIKSYSDMYLNSRIMEKMTNNKEAGEIYWLHF